MILVAVLIGIVFGLAMSLGLAVLITVKAIKKSNDIGDSQGTIADFNGNLDIYISEDGLNRMMG